jgi:hypothetical protein
MLGVKLPYANSGAGSSDPKKAPVSGMEAMLRSMGLSQVIEVAQQLAEAKTVEKVLKFADGLEELNARLARIETHLGTKTHADFAGGNETELVRLAEDGGGFESCPGSDLGGPELSSTERETEPFAEPATVRRSSAKRASNHDADT